MMDKTSLLKKRQALLQQQQLAQRLALHKELLSCLDAHHIDYQLCFDNPAIQWLQDNFAWHFSGLDFAQIVGAKKQPYDSIEQRDSIIAATLLSYLHADDQLQIAWGNALRPELQVSLADFLRMPELFIEQDFDCWLTHRASGFCLEHYHEGYVLWFSQPVVSRGNRP